MSISEQYFPDEWEIDFDSIFDNNLLNFFHKLVLSSVKFGQSIYQIYHIFQRQFLCVVLYCTNNLCVHFFQFYVVLPILMSTTQLSDSCKHWDWKHVGSFLNLFENSLEIFLIDGPSTLDELLLL